MTSKNNMNSNDLLRHSAEEVLARDEPTDLESITLEQAQHLLHELKVHQIELEMQNEELRQTQHQLEISRARYFDLYNLAPVGYLTVSGEGIILEANLTCATLFEVDRGELINRPFSSFIYPEDQDSYYHQRRQLLETGTTQSRDTRMLRSNGSQFWAHLQTSPAENHELRITLDDITELCQVKQELLKTQKIESLGILAGGIAHDFNNILAAIIGYISLARLQLSDPPKAMQRLEDAERAADRAKNLAKQLLTFARGGEPVKKIIDVRSILKEAAGFALLGSNVKCVLSLANDLLTVEADEGQIVQVIHNLVLNAVHAMPKGGTITVSAENTSASKSGQKFVRFSVADTGGGISEQNLQKIFDPYFTTKKQGSGLGLATSYSIIKKHGGKIRVTSTLGKGSTFTISLPASDHNYVSIPEAPKELARGNGRLLVMDDEKMIRNIMQTFLEKLGYTVVTAENGSEAVSLFLKGKEEGMPFAAVILDLTIPGGTGGQDIINDLLAIDPHVRAIACSGYSNDPVMANHRMYGFSGVLCKPFRLDELSNVLHELLKQ